jgi:hypothetical protein
LLSHQIHIQAPIAADQNECMAKLLSSFDNFHSMDARIVDKITGAWYPLPWFMRLDTQS